MSVSLTVLNMGSGVWHQASVLKGTLCQLRWCHLLVANLEQGSRIIWLTRLLITFCRYVDMIVNEGVRDTLKARARMMSALRRCLEERDFLEVICQQQEPYSLPFFLALVCPLVTGVSNALLISCFQCCWGT